MPRARTPVERIPALLFACVVLCAVRTASAAEEDPPPAMYLFVPGDEDGDGYRALEQALGAHAVRMGIAVGTVPVDEIPDDPRDQEVLARAILDDRDGRAVVWIDPRRRTVTLIHVDDDRRDNRLERRIDCIADHLGRCADAIASVVSSAVSSWAESPAPATEEAPPEVEYAVDNELSPVELNKPPWTKPDPLLVLSLAGGYGSALSAGTVRGVHGFDVGAAVRIARYVLVETVFDFWWPIEGVASENASWIDVGRWDVIARAGGALPVGRFVFALTAGAIFDLAEVEDRSEGVDFDGSGERRKGFSTALSARYRPMDWLAIWITAGLDALESDLVYRAPGEGGTPVTIVRCDALQGRLAGGIAVEIGLGSMPARR
jgi:hypothetical protein